MQKAENAFASSCNASSYLVVSGAGDWAALLREEELTNNRQSKCGFATIKRPFIISTHLGVKGRVFGRVKMTSDAHQM